MHTSTHAIAAPHRGRFIALLVALLLQAGFVWALVSGLSMKDIKDVIIGDPFFFDIPTHKPAALPEQLPDRTPQHVVVPPPDFNIGDEYRGPDTITPTDTRPQPPQGIPDSGPLSIAATHTTPPYPPIEARLGHQGTVVLRLTISPEGTVADAVVVRSSGFERLDEEARAWVLAHWHYRPAVRGGVPVASTGNVSVTFDLRNAG